MNPRTLEALLRGTINTTSSACVYHSAVLTGLCGLVLLSRPYPKYVPRGETTIPTHDLCHNWSIVWTKEMIAEFLPKLIPLGMTYSPNVEWSLDVLESFPNLW